MHTQRIATLLTLMAGLTPACATTDAAPPPAAEENSWLAEYLADSTRRPEPPQRRGERQPARVRSRGLADPHLPAVALQLSVRSGDASDSSPAAELRLVRFPDRVHLSAGAGGEEWLFLRNPVATDELAGVRVDHGSHYLIDYTDGELASESVIDGWARLAQLFVAPEELDLLRPTGERTTFAGVTFERRVRDAAAAVGEIVEIDWSDELGLPRRVVWRTHAGERVQELAALERVGAAELPPAFEERWPDYARKDLSDWREDVHGHAHADGHDHGDA